jgi:hypothetical protein
LQAVLVEGVRMGKMPLPRATPLWPAHLFTQFIPLALRDVEIEHHVLDVEAKLRQRFLNERQNASPTPHAIDHAIEGRFEAGLIDRRQRSDLPGEIDELARQFFFARRESRSGIHVRSSVSMPGAFRPRTLWRRT